MNLVELLKEEFCSRYGLKPEQIEVGVNVWDLESVELADQIRNDYFVEDVTYDFVTGGNMINEEDLNRSYYYAKADQGIAARKQNLLDVTAHTKYGVIKK